MSEQFQNITPPDEKLFFREADVNDVRLGEIVQNTKYTDANIVILGYPQDEGVRRCGGREGAALAPDAIRRQFYQLTPFGIHAKVCDLGNLNVGSSLEETHHAHTDVVSKILKDGKKIIVLGGGSDISYADGRAVAEVFGAENWIAINIDSHFHVRAGREQSCETSYRQLLEERLLRPDYLYEAAFQPHLASPVYYRYLQDLGVNLISLDQLRARETSDAELREQIRLKFINHKESISTFFSFDLNAVHASEAPGVDAPSPIGLSAGEFLNLVAFAAKLVNTKIIEFTEVNPNYDIDNRTTKLVAIAIHRFCSSI